MIQNGEIINHLMIWRHLVALFSLTSRYYVLRVNAGNKAAA